MAYTLGVDLGTTYTAAAVKRGDKLLIAELGTRSAAIPSVVFVREDGTILTAEAAVRRGTTEPTRLAREFKRRMGDTTPIILGGSPFSVDALMARLLADVLGSVTEREGGPPSAIAVAFPANWGQYKKDLLDQAIRRADLDDVTTITEPEAAAAHYASQERIETGTTIAVYDLGGGTFDAAVLRKTDDGFEFLGEPEGIERLGGIDFDEAVFRHVVESLRGAVEELDSADPVARAAVARLRAECVSAKEALSSDTDVSIPVMLPNVQTEVRLTRAEFEGMIRPALSDTIVVLERTIRSAGITPEQLHAVLLVGGSSRIPLVGQIVAADVGRPIAIDVHPKHSVAMGAALIAAGGEIGPVGVAAAATSGTDEGDQSDSAGAAGAAGAAGVAGAAGAAGAAAAGMPPVVSATEDPPQETAGLAHPPTEEQPATTGTPASSSAAATAAMAATTPTSTPAGETLAAPTEPIPAAPGPPPGPPPSGGSDGTGGSDGSGGSRNKTALIVVGVVIALLAAGGIVVALSGDGEGSTGTTITEQTTATTEAVETTVETAVDTTLAPDTTAAPETTAETTTTIPSGPCDGVAGSCIEIQSLASNGDAFVIEWTAFNFGPDVNGTHPHFYWNDATAEQAGNNAPPGTQVGWEITDELVYTTDSVLLLSNRPPAATGICGTPGDANLDPPHSVIDPEIFHCVDLPIGASG
jgi:actin-like ATPase involved in cell morphogenesis